MLNGDARRHGLQVLRVAINRSGARRGGRSPGPAWADDRQGDRRRAGRAIVAEREANGAYRSLTDLLRRAGLPRVAAELMTPSVRSGSSAWGVRSCSGSLDSSYRRRATEGRRTVGDHASSVWSCRSSRTWSACRTWTTGSGWWPTTGCSGCRRATTRSAAARPRATDLVPATRPAEGSRRDARANGRAGRLSPEAWHGQGVHLPVARGRDWVDERRRPPGPVRGGAERSPR